ncbi:MAG: lipoprotein [Nitrosomonas sp.]|nr:lipoprotein [Nitrosomonas sp.]
MRLFCTTLLITLILSACGLKGPLYLPENNPPTQTTEDETSDS